MVYSSKLRGERNMELWVLSTILLMIQTIDLVQPIRVNDTSSKFLIVANSQDQKDLPLNENRNDLVYPTFNSNKSHPKIRNGKKKHISPPTVQTNFLDAEKTDIKKGSSNLIIPSVEITPANSQYLGFTVGNQLMDVSSSGKANRKREKQKDQSLLRTIQSKQPQTMHPPKKYTNVKLPEFQNQTPFLPSKDFLPLSSSNIENTIHRPKIQNQVEPEKPVHEYFSSDLTELIEKAQRLDLKGSSRKHRNSDDSLGLRSDKYEVQDYLDHKPYGEVDGEYHVYHGAPEKKKKKEIHYHQHKHLHEHDHDQKHSHKHQSDHHHDHGHDHHQKHSHSHGHDDDHWHDHQEKGEHHHQSHHGHDHHGSHDHKHHEDHDHKHDSGHHHDHEDHHDHHEDHKNWHSHKHHSEHDHRHGHDHKHRSKHGHDHHHGHKHKHSHHQKHGGKH